MSEIRHELRTHLNHIVGYSEMILEEAEDLRWTTGRRAMEDVIAVSQDLTESISNIIRYLDIGDREHCAEAINVAAQPAVLRIRRLADQASSDAVSSGYIETSADANRVVHACQNITDLFENGLRPKDDSFKVDSAGELQYTLDDASIAALSAQNLTNLRIAGVEKYTFDPEALGIENADFWVKRNGK